MRKEDVKIGMKVVPHSKTRGVIDESMSAYLSIGCCFSQSDFFRKNGFLYVTGIRGDDFLLWYNTESDAGDYFSASDFEPYDEPKPQSIKVPVEVDLLFDKPVVEENLDEVYIFSGRSTVYVNKSLGVWGMSTVNSNEINTYDKRIGKAIAYYNAFVERME